MTKSLTSAQVSESRLHSSFLLAPAEGEQLVGYEPGQYLSLRLDIPGTEHSHARNYSLSDEPATDPVTRPGCGDNTDSWCIERPGRVPHHRQAGGGGRRVQTPARHRPARGHIRYTQYLHYLQSIYNISTLSTLSAEAGVPCGDFVLQPGPGPAVFLGAGVGITPLLSMMKVSARRGNKVTSEPPRSTVVLSCSVMFRTR